MDFSQDSESHVEIDAELVKIDQSEFSSRENLLPEGQFSLSQTSKLSPYANLQPKPDILNTSGIPMNSESQKLEIGSLDLETLEKKSKGTKAGFQSAGNIVTSSVNHPLSVKLNSGELSLSDLERERLFLHEMSNVEEGARINEPLSSEGHLAQNQIRKIRRNAYLRQKQKTNIDMHGLEKRPRGIATLEKKFKGTKADSKSAGNIVSVSVNHSTEVKLSRNAHLQRKTNIDSHVLEKRPRNIATMEKKSKETQTDSKSAGKIVTSTVNIGKGSTDVKLNLGEDKLIDLLMHLQILAEEDKLANLCMEQLSFEMSKFEECLRFLIDGPHWEDIRKELLCDLSYLGNPQQNSWKFKDSLGEHCRRFSLMNQKLELLVTQSRASISGRSSNHIVTIAAADTCLDLGTIDIKPDASGYSIYNNSCGDVKCDSHNDIEYGIAETLLDGSAIPLAIVNIAAADTCLDQGTIDIKTDVSEYSIYNNSYGDVKCDCHNDIEYGIAETFLDGSAVPVVIDNIAAVDTCLNFGTIIIKTDASGYSIHNNFYGNVKCDSHKDIEYGIAETFLDGSAAPVVIVNIATADTCVDLGTIDIKPDANGYSIHNNSHGDARCVSQNDIEYGIDETFLEGSASPVVTVNIAAADTCLHLGTINIKTEHGIAETFLEGSASPVVIVNIAAVDTCLKLGAIDIRPDASGYSIHNNSYGDVKCDSHKDIEYGKTGTLSDGSASPAAIVNIAAVDTRLDLGTIDIKPDANGYSIHNSYGDVKSGSHNDIEYGKAETFLEGSDAPLAIVNIAAADTCLDLGTIDIKPEASGYSIHNNSYGNVKCDDHNDIEQGIAGTFSEGSVSYAVISDERSDSQYDNYGRRNEVYLTHCQDRDNYIGNDASLTIIASNHKVNTTAGCQFDPAIDTKPSASNHRTKNNSHSICYSKRGNCNKASKDAIAYKTPPILPPPQPPPKCFASHHLFESTNRATIRGHCYLNNKNSDNIDISNRTYTHHVPAVDDDILLVVVQLELNCLSSHILNGMNVTRTEAVDANATDAKSRDDTATQVESNNHSQTKLIGSVISTFTATTKQGEYANAVAIAVAADGFNFEGDDTLPIANQLELNCSSFRTMNVTKGIRTEVVHTNATDAKPSNDTATLECNNCHFPEIHGCTYLSSKYSFTSIYHTTYNRDTLKVLAPRWWDSEVPLASMYSLSTPHAPCSQYMLNCYFPALGGCMCMNTAHCAASRIPAPWCRNPVSARLTSYHSTHPATYSHTSCSHLPVYCYFHAITFPIASLRKESARCTSCSQRPIVISSDPRPFGTSCGGLKSLKWHKVTRATARVGQMGASPLIIGNATVILASPNLRCCVCLSHGTNYIIQSVSLLHQQVNIDAWSSPIPRYSRECCLHLHAATFTGGRAELSNSARLTTNVRINFTLPRERVIKMLEGICPSIRGSILVSLTRTNVISNLYFGLLSIGWRSQCMRLIEWPRSLLSRLRKIECSIVVHGGVNWSRGAPDWQFCARVHIHRLHAVTSIRWQFKPLTNRQRLHLLLWCYKKHKHHSRGKLEFWAISNTLIPVNLSDRNLGKGFSSCIAGDGPVKPITLANGQQIYPGLRVFVDWSSFPEARGPIWARFQNYKVEGHYVQIRNRQWQVSFPALNQMHWKGPHWITEYGSTQLTDQPVLLKDLYLQHSSWVDLETGPPKKKLKKEHPTSQFKPSAGMKIYVSWKSFPLSNEYPLTEYPNAVAVGFYNNPTTKGWNVRFPVLGTVHYLQPWSWVDKWGSTTTLPEGAHVVRKSEVTTPKEPRSYLEVLKAHEPDSEDEYSPPSNEQIDIPDIQIDDQWAKSPNLESTNMGVSILNINSMSEGSLTLGREFWQVGCGINFFIDTRIPESRREGYRLQWQGIAGKGSSVIITPQSTEVGGQLVLLDPYWNKRVISTWTDPTQLGIVFEVKLYTCEGVTRIVSVYWPVPGRDDTNALGAQVTRWLQEQNREITVNEYVLDIIRSRLRRPARRHILLGDLNQRFDKVNKLMLGLQDAHSGATFSTFYKGLNPINKIDFILHSGKCLSAGRSTGPEWQPYTDHRPIWAIFESAGPRAKVRKSAFHTVKRNFKKVAQSEAYQEEMYAAQFAGLDPSETALHICRMAKKHSEIRVPHRKLALWSPATAAILIRQDMVKDLLRQARGSTAPAFETVDFIIRRANNRTHEIGKDGPKLWEDPEVTLFTIEQIRGFCINQQVNLLKDEAVAITKLLHGRKRKQRLDLIKERVGKIRKDPYRFFKTLGPRRISLDLSRLNHQGETLTSPQDIDALLARNFEESFQDPGIPRQLWETLTEKNLRVQFPQVPEHLRASIWKSLHSVPNEKRLKVEGNLSRDKVTPTRDEFYKVLQASSNSSAGGPTGATYEMLKHMPLETIDALYDSLLSCWSNQSLPSWWNSKLLYLLAKRPNDFELNNIRPIVLLETTRKLWFKIIGRKVMTAITDQGILQDNQYGFRSHRSTSDNLIQLVNTLEASEGHALFATSWDIVGAFNAPPRPWLEFALRRVGVPQELAEILAYIDDDEVTSLLTPYRASTGSGQTFTAKRGCGQGDVTSPMLWNLYFDIVLTALNECKSEIYFVDDHHLSHQVSDTAFADDLLSFGASMKIVQDKADIISAASTILDFQLATKKFRTFSMGATGSVTTYDHEWKPTITVCSTEGFIRYLGSRFSIEGGYDEEVRHMVGLLLETLERIKHKVHRSAHGIAYVNRAITPKLVYPGSMGIIPIHNQNHLSSKLGAEYKKHVHVQQSFPQAVLNAPTTAGGLGFNDPKEAIAAAKWGIITRTLAGSNAQSKAALRGILYRQAFRTNNHLHNNRHIIGSCKGTWLEDVENMLAVCGTQLTGFHCLETNQLDTPLQQTPGMINLGIRSLGDIIETNNGGRIIAPTRVGLQSSDWPTLVVDTIDILFTPGQVWANNAQPRQLYVLQGWLNQQLVVESWSATFPHWHRGQHRYSRSRMETVDPTTLTYKCLTSFSGDVRILSFITGITGRRRQWIQTSEYQQPRESGTVVATDATFSSRGGILSDFHPGATGGAIVIIDDTFPYTRRSAMHLELPVTAGRAYTSELASMALALRLYQGQILSDCQGAITALQSGASTLAPALASTGEAHRLTWQRSHPERHALSGDWSASDHAIAYADRVAEGSQPATSLTFLEVSEQTLHRSNCWVANGPAGMLLDDPNRLQKIIRLEAYLAQRVKSRRAVWNANGLKFITSFATTIPQRASYAKLYLGRYHADIQYETGTRPQCVCSSACRNILDDWLSVCQRPDIASTRAAHQESMSKLDIPTPLWNIFIQQLQQQDNVLLYRGHLSNDVQQALATGFNQQQSADLQRWKKSIRTFLGLTTTYSLQLQHIISSSDKVAVSMQHPTVKPGESLFLPNTSPIVPELVTNYTTPLHTAVLETPSIHIPTPLPVSANTRSDKAGAAGCTPLRTHLYPQSLPKRQKKTIKNQDQPTSSASSLPAHPTRNSHSKPKMPSYSTRPAKRTVPELITDHYPRTQDTPARKKIRQQEPRAAKRRQMTQTVLPLLKKPRITRCSCWCHALGRGALDLVFSQRIVCSSSNSSSRNSSSSSSSSSSSISSNMFSSSSCCECSVRGDFYHPP